MKTVTAQEFNRDASRIKREASAEPVVITDHGRPSHVLLAIDEYERLTGGGVHDLADWLAMDDRVDLEVEPLDIELRVPEL
jgi:prevent-host-death family protein